jgi:hypothetical protein
MDDDGPGEQAVIATFTLADGEWGDPDEFDALFELEAALTRAIEENGVGEFDGYGRGMGACNFFMYGPDADALFAAVLPLIRVFPARPGSSVVKRYGEPGAPEVRVHL